MRTVNSEELTEEAIARLPQNDKEWLYNCLDCCVTMEVFEEIPRDNVVLNTYEFSRALQAPILEMQLRGLLVDQGRREKVMKEYERDQTRLAEQLRQIVTEGVGLTEPLNWGSPAQLKHLFYTVFGLPPVKKRNAQGVFAPTTNRDALEHLRDNYLVARPICAHILALRDLGKRLGFLRTALDPDGRIRTAINIAGTETGRLASAMSEFGTGTNLQNIERRLRSCFVSDPGYKFCNIDLEQGDSRNVGAICAALFTAKRGRDFAHRYLDACESGDLHTTVTKLARPDLPWGTDTDRAIADLTAYRDLSHRDMSKKLGHGTNYLVTPPTANKHTHIAIPLIEDFQRAYFAAFPCIPAWQNHTINEIQTTYELTTLFGRRRIFFDRATDPATHRKAIAYCPQSMTADEINRGMLELWRRDTRIQLLMQVHDSILFQYPEELEEEIVPLALKIINNAAKLILPGDREFFVPGEAKVGWNWDDVEFNKDKTVKSNPYGLIKYKGADNRTSPKRGRFGSLEYGE